MSAFSLDDPETIRRFTQNYLQAKPVHVKAQAEPADETKSENEMDIDASLDHPSGDRDQSFEDHDEPPVSSGHESLDHADHQSHNTSEKSVYGDQQSDRTDLSDHADAFSNRSSVGSVLPSDQIDGQSDRSDEQSDRADEQYDHADSQSNHDFQQPTHPSEHSDHADTQSNHSYQQSTHASSRSDHTDTQSKNTYGQYTHANDKSDYVDPQSQGGLDYEIYTRTRHQATQTEPVNIYSAQTKKMIHPKTQAESFNSSATGSPSTTFSETVASQSSDMKGKSANDSVLLMSPKLSGILPPPSTPETQPDLSGSGISKLIISEVEILKPLSMGESRHAPRTSGSHGRYRPFRLAPKSTESVTGSSGPSSPPGKLSDLGSGTPGPWIKTVIDDNTSKLPSLPDSTESSHCHTPSTFKPGAGATALTTTTPPTGYAINDSEISSNDNFVDHDSIKDKSASGKFIHEELDDGKSVDHESTNNESVNGNETESKSTENEFIKSNSSDDAGANEKSFHGKSADSKPVGAGPVRRGAYLPPHLRHLENIVQGSLDDHTSEGISTDQSDTAEGIQQDQSDATTNSRTGKKPNIEVSTGNTPRPYADGTVGSDLTPSSMIFHLVSPPANADIGNEDRTFQQFFGGWGKPEARTTAPAKVRKVILRIPDADPSFIASLVWGGLIDEIIIKAKSAEVIFAFAEDCDKYYDTNRKGIPYKRKGSDKIQYAIVDKGSDVNVVGGLLQTYLDQGFTRCVRVTNVPADISFSQLQRKAGYKGRKFEGIEDGKLSTGLRYVIFRFCTIASAVQFKKALEREEEWEQCNIHYSPDPCASPTRFDSLSGV